MVPAMLLKLLHCKLKNRKKLRRAQNGFRDSSHGEKSQPFEMKVEKCDEEEKTCRVCLKEGNVPIYGSQGFDDISNELITFGGIEVTFGDNYPKYLCQDCNSSLQAAIMFRKTAQQSDHLLKNPEESMMMVNKDDYDVTNNSDEDFDYKLPQVERKESKVKDKRFHCKKCDLIFESHIDYQDHRLTEEHENMRVNCPICNNKYVPEYLKKHLALHKQETPYMCDICGKKFILVGQFNRHRLTHFYNLPFKCTMCPYRGRFSESLKMHMRTHTGEKPYQCPQCPTRFFVNKSNLNKHVLTHQRSFEFKCSVCQRGFHTQRDLDVHFKVDHTGIKDHICKDCGKAFGYRKQLMKHLLKVHKREKLKSGRTPLYVIMDKKHDEQMNNEHCNSDILAEKE